MERELLVYMLDYLWYASMPDVLTMSIQKARLLSSNEDFTTFSAFLVRMFYQVKVCSIAS